MKWQQIQPYLSDISLEVYFCVLDNDEFIMDLIKIVDAISELLHK